MQSNARPRLSTSSCVQMHNVPVYTCILSQATLRLSPTSRCLSFKRLQPCQVTKSVSSEDQLLEAQQLWPAWSNNACKRLSQKQAGVQVTGPGPTDAAQILQQLARSCQHANARSQLALGNDKVVRGLVEALQVTAPRPSAADHMGLFLARPADYPSQMAVAQLSAKWAAVGIWALAVLGSATLYEAETEGLIQVGQAHQWQPLTATQAVNCCWGLAHARHCTPALHDILQANQLSASLAQLKAQQITTLLWSCATLNHQPMEILASLASQYRQRPEGLVKFNSNALATFAWSLAVLQQLHHPLFGMAWAALCTGRHGVGFRTASFLQVHQVCLEARMCGVNISIAGSQNMLRDAKEEWMAEAENKNSKQGSSYVHDISDIIVGFGMAYIQEYTSPHYAVDIALPALKVAIEVDGPTHRSRNTGHALGATAMKQRHVRAAGWRLMTVSHSEWDQLRGRQHKQEFLQSKLDALYL